MAFETSQVFGYAGVCRLHLELEMPAAGWEERITGRLVLQSGRWQEPVQIAEVSLVDDQAAAMGSHSVVETARWNDFRLQAGEQLPLPFSLTVPWGLPFDQSASIRARVDPERSAPAGLTVPVHIRPPGRFVEIAGVLAEASELRVGGWSRSRRSEQQTRAVAHLKPQPGPVGEFRGARLELYRRAGELIGDVTLLPRRQRPGGLLRRWLQSDRFCFSVEFRTADPSRVSAAFENWLRSFREGQGDLPLPAAPATASEALPLSAAPPAVDGHSLPLPGDGTSTITPCEQTSPRHADRREGSRRNAEILHSVQDDSVAELGSQSQAGLTALPR